MTVQGDGGAAWGRGIRKDPVPLSALSAPALRCRHTRRTVSDGPRAWVKFAGFGLQAPRSWLCRGRVVERSLIESVLAGTVRISVASRSAAPLTRLETRTKEFNMCASHWAFETQRRSESKV